MDHDVTLERDARRRRWEPTWLAGACAVRRARRAFASPEGAERAREAVAPVAAGASLDTLALRHLVVTELREELLWRPWTLDGEPTRGATEEVRAALASGRGVLVTYCHYGLFPCLVRVLRPLAPSAHSVGGHWMFAPPGDDATGLRHARWVRTVEEAGIELLDAEGCFPVVCERLRAGGLVAIAFDVRGSVPTRLLGLDTSLTSGPATMAWSTGALVVPALRAWRRGRPVTLLGAPLDPRGHRDWRELHAAVAAVHDAWMRPRPEAHERPARLLDAC